MKHAFSLVELSIVLVILGLLTGGILGGQALIRAAELRAVSTEYGRYAAAAMTFRDKYFAVPGDFRDATRFWGWQVNGSNCTTNSSAAVNSAGACDGNGDGTILWDNSGAVSTSREMHQFWRHLALAGLVEGTYTGLAGPTTNSADVVPGTNSPRAKLANAGWGAAQTNCGYGGGCFTTMHIANGYPPYFMFGRQWAGGGNVPGGNVLKPEEAWNIDTKMDDGRPVSGKIIPLYQNSTNLCSTAASATDTSATYLLSSTTVGCSLYFLNAF